MSTEKASPTFNKYVVRRYARERHALPQETVKILSPKQPPQTPGKPNLMMMLPTIAMSLMTGALAYYRASQTSSSGMEMAVMTVLPMMMMGMMMMGVQWWSYRNGLKKHAADVEGLDAEYRGRLQGIEEKLVGYAAQQHWILNNESPGVTELLKRVAQRDKRLWERQPTDNDFLALRLGVGVLPISVDIRPPEQDDDPRNQPAIKLARAFALVERLPIVMNLGHLGTVGMRGVRPSESLYLAFTLVANIAVHHSPDEVYLYVLSHRSDAAEVWGWLRWLPHTNALHGGQGGESRLSFGDGEADEAILLELSQLLRQRGDEKRQGRRLNPHVVVIFDQTPNLQGHPVIGMLLEHDPQEKGNKLQASALFIENPIPPQANALVSVKGTEVDYRETWREDANQARYRGTAELTTPKQMEQLARGMAPLRTEANYNAGGGNLPSSVRLVELLGATQPKEIDLGQLYSPMYDPQKVMAFPVGYNVDLKPQMVILRETGQGGHGSHAMLAGMTGTGKSVLLQAIVMSLALTNSPEHLNFILADFKGGASELAKVQGLPHIAGFVTDLNLYMVERFRISLESEILRRKMMFDEAKEHLGQPVANIRTYNKLYPDTPLPHLVVLLDEFAHGLQINPGFRSAIDTIAGQGRALGVHLILSTQRAADFDAKIKPNIDVRLSLRVASREDSKTMFNRDEAFTRLTRPGQAYLQVGDNEVFEMFQAARADVPYQPEGAVNLSLVDSFAIFRVGADGRRFKEPLYEHTGDKGREQRKQVTAVSEAEVLVEHVQVYCNGRYAPVRQICLPPLPDSDHINPLLKLHNLPTFRQWQGAGSWTNVSPDWRLRLVIGLLDLPAQQDQRPYVVDFNQGDGNFLVIGPTGSGKNLFLRRILSTLITTHAPDDVNVYILGRGTGLSQFEDAPHCCGNLIRPTEGERLSRLIIFFQEEIIRRRMLMRHTRTDTVAALRQTAPTNSLPTLFLVIEDYARFKAENENSQPERLSQVQSFIQEGKSVDLHVLIGSTDIKSVQKLLDSLQNRLVLGANSENYLMVFNRRLEPLPDIPGRGYTVVEQTPVECQIAAPLPDAAPIILVCREMNENWRGYRPVPIIELPGYIELLWLWSCVQTKMSKDMFVASLQEISQSPLPGLEFCPPFYSEPMSSSYKWMTVPIGVENNQFTWVSYDLIGSSNYSLFIGPAKSGKTNLLFSIALATAVNVSPVDIEMIVFDFKPPYALQGLSRLPHVRYATQTMQAKQYLAELLGRLEEQASVPPLSMGTNAERLTATGSLSLRRGKYTVIFIDDWLVWRQKGDGEMFKLLDSCIQKGVDAGLKVIFADTSQNMKQVSQMQSVSIPVKMPNGQTSQQSYPLPFVSAAYNCGRGVVFTSDPNDAAPFLLPTRMKMTAQQLQQVKLNKGRAFVLEQDEGAMVQFARFGLADEPGMERDARLKGMIQKIVDYHQTGADVETAVMPDTANKPDTQGEL